MIIKGSTSAVNFLVLDTDGFPVTGQASNITATISINGVAATAISDTITEKGDGWYYFNHTFNTVGNIFIEFAATNCTIMPWEEEVCEINLSGLDSLDSVYSSVLNWTVSGNTLTLYNSDSTVLSTFTISRDSSGNITGVRPTA